MHMQIIRSRRLHFALVFSLSCLIVCVSFSVPLKLRRRSKLPRTYFPPLRCRGRAENCKALTLT